MDIYLGLGSNLGNRTNNLKNAIHLLNFNDSIDINSLSSIYETEPKHFVKQPFFLNMVVSVSTELDCFNLLKNIKKIEKKMFRESKPKYHSRIIDIDILSYKKSVIKTHKLTIPHSLIHERKFVLIPWNEISPNHIPAGQEKTINELLLCSKDLSEVKKYRKFKDVNISYSY